MRVLFVINSLGAGGTERSTAVLLPHLRARGVDATVACLLHRDEGDEATVRADGFDVRILPGGWGPRLKALRALIREVRPDVVHTAIFDADVAGRLASARLGVPVLTSLVNTPYTPERFADPRITPWKLRVVQRVDSITGRATNAAFHAVTAGVADDGVRSLGFSRSRIAVVERGRDPDELGRRTDERRNAGRERLGHELGTDLAAGVALVVAAGRQEFQKDHVTLVEAIAIAAHDLPAVQLVVAGREGNATPDLLAAIERTGTGGRTHLLGHRTDVADLLCAADVFAMPSRYEGTAGAALEALALESPIVATELDGTAGLLVEGDNAHLVPVGDARALAAALVDVLGDPVGAAQRAARGRALFDQRFTLARSADAMVDLYRSVVATGPRRLTR